MTSMSYTRKMILIIQPAKSQRVLHILWVFITSRRLLIDNDKYSVLLYMQNTL